MLTLMARISLPLGFVRFTRVVESPKAPINEALDLGAVANSFNSFSINLHLLIRELRMPLQESFKLLHQMPNDIIKDG
jgi:hypothetical protein